MTMGAFELFHDDSKPVSKEIAEILALMLDWSAISHNVSIAGVMRSDCPRGLLESRHEFRGTLCVKNTPMSLILAFEIATVGDALALDGQTRASR